MRPARLDAFLAAASACRKPLAVERDQWEIQDVGRFRAARVEVVNHRLGVLALEKKMNGVAPYLP